VASNAGKNSTRVFCATSFYVKSFRQQNASAAKSASRRS
jgi:hypothetical protein